MLPNPPNTPTYAIGRLIYRGRLVLDLDHNAIGNLRNSWISFENSIEK